MIHKSLMNALGLAVVAGIGMSTSVLAQDLSKLPPPSKQTGVTYEKDIQPIFKATCVGCHGPTRPPHNIRLDSLEGVLKGGRDGKVIEVGEAQTAFCTGRLL